MALLTKLKFTGKVESLLLRPSRDAGFEKAETGQLLLQLDGPAGDCHAGLTRKSDSRTLMLYKRGLDIRNVRQLTLLSAAELAEVAQRLGLPLIDPSWFGANMVVSGIRDFTFLPPSTRLQFPSGATLVVDMENLPCSQIDKAVAMRHPSAAGKVVKAAMGKRGVTCWVEREGTVSSGDEITIFIPQQRVYPHGL
jgi:hypothetical protein